VVRGLGRVARTEQALADKSGAALGRPHTARRVACGSSAPTKRSSGYR
jgi:hypothetical protein